MDKKIPLILARKALLATRNPELHALINWYQLTKEIETQITDTAHTFHSDANPRDVIEQAINLVGKRHQLIKLKSLRDAIMAQVDAGANKKVAAAPLPAEGTDPQDILSGRVQVPDEPPVLVLERRALPSSHIYSAHLEYSNGIKTKPRIFKMDSVQRTVLEWIVAAKSRINAPLGEAEPRYRQRQPNFPMPQTLSDYEFKGALAQLSKALPALKRLDSANGRLVYQYMLAVKDVVWK